MFETQNETNSKNSGQRAYFKGDFECAPALSIIQNQENCNQDSNLKSENQNLKSSRSAFTLTELLVVITIIAVLASLTIGAALNAIDASNRTGIITELQQVGAAVEDFKNEFGAYPPNGMVTSGNLRAQSDFVRMFKKAFPRHKEPNSLILALAGGGTSSVVTHSDVNQGMNGAEAAYFWLGGFSKDASYPISGPGGPSFVDNGSPSDEVLEDRQQRYEFDLGRLGPKDNGTFSGRYITYEDPQNNSRTRRINLWYYAPKGVSKPMVYFDTSRHLPTEYDLPMWGNNIYAIKQLRQGITAASSNEDIRFVEDKKFQILHAGTDDEWGDSFAFFQLASPNLILAPEGPFLGEIADTLGHFMEGTLEDKQE